MFAALPTDNARVPSHRAPGDSGSAARQCLTPLQSFVEGGWAMSGGWGQRYFFRLVYPWRTTTCCDVSLRVVIGDLIMICRVLQGA